MSALDLWFSIMNQWDDELYEAIPEHMKSRIPVCPNGDPYFYHCSIETLSNLIEKKVCNYDCLYTTLAHAFSTCNMEKAMVILETKLISDDDIVKVMTDIQCLYLMDCYQIILDNRMDLWDRIPISPRTLYDILQSIDYVIKIFSRCRDDRLVDIICLMIPPDGKTLSLLGSRIPVSWAMRTPLSDDILDTVLRYQASIEVIRAIVNRRCVVTTDDIITLMSYPPSEIREEVYYKCLSLIGMNERTFLSTHLGGKRLEKLNLIDKMARCELRYSNDYTLYGTSVSDIPCIFAHEDMKYILDIREIIHIVKKGSYINPYTREKTDATPIITKYRALIEEEVPTGDPSVVPVFPNMQLDVAVEEMMEKHDLSAYMSEILTMTVLYGPMVVLALDCHPNIIRFFNNSVYETVLFLEPDLHSLIRSCI